MIIVAIFSMAAFGETGTDPDQEEQTPDCTEHFWDEGKVMIEPTYLRSGEKVFTCTACGASKTEETAKLEARNKWVKCEGKWRYFDSKGSCVKSVSLKTRNKWVKAGDKKFYFSSRKRPCGKGFHMIKGKLYYMGAGGALKKGSFTVKGEKIKTAKNGSITGLPYYKRKYKKFVYVDISDQSLQCYEGTKLLLKCPVVTGNHSKGWDTPTGNYKVTHKSRNTYLINGTTRTYVAYWMSFIRNEYGMHDAGWRGSKDYNSHSTYKKNGSHGCVNMRRKDAEKLYGVISVGTPVIIRK